MKKLRIALDGLHVDTFETTERSAQLPPGTVFGQSVVPDTADCSSAEQCNVTSPEYGCHGTVADNTCWQGSPECTPTVFMCPTSWQATCNPTNEGTCFRDWC